MKPSAAHPIVVKGLPAEQEARIRESLDNITVGPSMFASAVGGRLVPTEVEVFQRAKDGKLQARMVYELTVSEGLSVRLVRVQCCPVPKLSRAMSRRTDVDMQIDMLNVGRTMHGGCAVYLIDVCVFPP